MVEQTEKPRLYLYHIWRTDRVDRDEYDAFIVAAPSSKAARKYVTDNYGFTRDTSQCQRIGIAHPKTIPGVVLGSFNAG